MRSTLLAAAGATTLVVLAGGHAALASSPAADRAAATTLNLVAHDQTDTSVDVGRKGFSAGDQEVSTLKLSGDATGRGTITCQAMSVSRKKAVQQCSGTFSLAGGTVTFFGPTIAGHNGPAPFDWAVTGGTGAYSQATGALHVVPGNRTVHMTLQLQS
jgi:hypothetical protein